MINEPIKGFVYVTLLSRQIYKLTALCMERSGLLLHQLASSLEEAELSKALYITRFALCFFIEGLSLFYFEMAEEVIDRVQ